MTAGRRKGQRVGPIRKEAKEGNWLYEERMACGVTIEQLAKAAHISVRTIKRIEAGAPASRRNTPTFVRIKHALREIRSESPLAIAKGDICRQKSPS